MTQKSKKICRTCKYWKYRKNRWGILKERDMEFGECDNSLKIIGNLEGRLIKVWNACGQVGGWFASHPDFGCVLWEERK